jgi:hypothetical protein
MIPSRICGGLILFGITYRLDFLRRRSLHELSSLVLVIESIAVRSHSFD